MVVDDVFKIFQSKFQKKDLQMSQNRKDHISYAILKKGVS